jgi:hypothetical protein
MNLYEAQSPLKAYTSASGHKIPTPLQRTFAHAYLTTGSAAKAARAAGYSGRFAAQAGYKLLKRAGTRVALNELIEMERINLRKYILRGLRKVEGAVRAPENPLHTLDAYAGLVVYIMRLMGLAEERACQVLGYWLKVESPQLRRKGLLGELEEGRKV